jgi:hypothetical protein
MHYHIQHNHLEMLLPELEVNLLASSLLTRLVNIPCCNIGSAKVHTDFCPKRALEAIHVGAIEDTIAHTTQQALEIRSAKIRPRLEFSEGILVRTHRVEHNVLRGVCIHFLREIGVDAQELVTVVAAKGLGFERGKKRLEPLEGRCVFADPDEFDTAETLGRVGAETKVVDGFEDGCPGCHANTGSNQDGDFVLEDVFSGGSIGSVDLEAGHGLTVLEGDFVHAHGVELVVKLGLRLTGTKSVGKSTGEVTDLANVDRDVRVVGAGSDRKWMPLVIADFRAVEKEPLSWLVLHAGLGELNLHGICSVLVWLWVSNLLGKESYRMGDERP